MAVSTVARLAVIEEKLDTIKEELDGIRGWMKIHNEEHKRIDEKITKHDIIYGGLLFISGLLAAGVVKLLFFGG